DPAPAQGDVERLGGRHRHEPGGLLVVLDPDLGLGVVMGGEPPPERRFGPEGPDAARIGHDWGHGARRVHHGTELPHPIAYRARVATAQTLPNLHAMGPRRGLSARGMVEHSWSAKRSGRRCVYRSVTTTE